jgi:hypothetical protein
VLCSSLHPLLLLLLLLTTPPPCSITRNNLGPYKAQVLGLPSLIFVTGVVTQYIIFVLLEASTDQLDVLDFAEWEAGASFYFLGGGG